MTLRVATLVALLSIASWIETGARSINDILSMEKELEDPSSEWGPRVIGGRNAVDGEFPWMVALHYQGRFICSSSLITPGVLMTAAHCVVFSDSAESPNKYNAYAGTCNRDGPDTEMRFSEIIAHPQYGSGTEYDIALMKLKEPMKLSDKIQTVCLPSQGSKYEDIMAQAMGWGVYEKRGRDPSPSLLTLTEHVPRNSLCRFTYGLMGIPITDRHVCAGGADRGICFGDSGGPLVDMNGTRPTAIGVASFGSFLGCAVRGVPAVYTSTGSYLDWIQENMGDEAKNMCFT